DLILPFEFDSIYYIEPLAKSSLELSKMREANKDLSASKEQIFFVVKKEDKFGVIDNHRKWIVQPQNYLIKYFDKDMGFIISDGLYYGIMNMQGKLIVKPQYEEIYKFSNGFYKISKEGKVGIIDKKGEIVLEPKFDDIDTNDYPFKFKQDTRYGFLDEKAEVLFEINFAHKDDFNNDILTLANKYWLVRKERKYQI
ncbi:TPA: WG repeat-containing protein, partial [Campylobacter coli]|nr:WG repeat-containing protein [Campylobacter coli]